MSAYKLNKMASTIRKLESYLPTSLYPLAYTFVFNNMVKLARTSGLRVETLTPRKVEVVLKNRRHIQNHIKGLHACSLALAAESATGMVVGMNVQCARHAHSAESMNVNFVRRCQGGVRATATISDEDYKRIHEDDRGDVTVDVRVEDESGNEPIKAEMIWAWVSKDRSKKEKPANP